MTDGVLAAAIVALFCGVSVFVSCNRYRHISRIAFCFDVLNTLMLIAFFRLVGML